MSIIRETLSRRQTWKKTYFKLDAWLNNSKRLLEFIAYFREMTFFSSVVTWSSALKVN